VFIAGLIAYLRFNFKATFRTMGGVLLDYVMRSQFILVVALTFLLHGCAVKQADSKSEALNEFRAEMRMNYRMPGAAAIRREKPQAAVVLGVSVGTELSSKGGLQVQTVVLDSSELKELVESCVRAVEATSRNNSLSMASRESLLGQKFRLTCTP